jgi:uncharacterized membrane protein (DUF4010 family)
MDPTVLALGSPEPIWSLLVAALLGFLIGLERERKRETQGSIFAGIRTFPLIAVFGAIVGQLTLLQGNLVLFAGFLAMTVLVALAYWRESSGEKVGGTTEIAVLVAFGLGIMTTIDSMVVALAGAVIITTILSMRKELRRLSTAITREDLFAVVQFAAVTLVVLPLVPDETLGPWGVWNPRTIWLEVVLISGISFVGYVAIKAVGARGGSWLSGVLGGLASSTAVMLTFSRRSKLNPLLSGIFAFGALLASAASVPRLLLIIGVVKPDMIIPTLLPLLTIMLLTVAGAFMTLRRRSEQNIDDIKVSNPFELRTALEFGLLFALILLITQAAQVYLGEGGIYLASVLGGLTRPEAIALSLGKQVSEGLDTVIAVRGISLAVAVNSVFKGVLGMALGSRAFGRTTLLILVIAGLAAIAVAWLLPVLTFTLPPG